MTPAEELMLINLNELTAQHQMRMDETDMLEKRIATIRREVEGIKIITTAASVHNDYPSGHNKAIERVLAIIDKEMKA